MDEYIPGQHLAVSQLLYTHHGIYAGDGFVIHYVKGGIIYDRLDGFSGGLDITVIHHPGSDLDKALERAYSRLWEDKYHLLFNNCEGFCNWCHTGINISHQVVQLITELIDLISGF